MRSLTVVPGCSRGEVEYLVAYLAEFIVRVLCVIQIGIISFVMDLLNEPGIFCLPQVLEPWRGSSFCHVSL